jgi:hypothetical protein
MPNKIKTTGSTTKRVATRNTNFSVGVDASDDYGPTSTTGFYNGITPPVGGYTLYVHKASGGPSIHVANDDNQCIFFLKSFGATGSTISEVLSWATARTDVWVQTTDLTSGDLVSAPSGTLVTSATLSSATIVSQSPFSGGGNAYSLVGSTSSYLSVAGQDGFAFGTGDFTIEWFEYDRGSSSFPRIFWISSTAGSNSPVLGLSQEGSAVSRTNYVWTGAAASSLASTAITTNTWYHFALVRISGKIYLYKDGTILNSGGTNYTSNYTNNTATFYIGSKSGGGLSSEQYYGYITNFRVVKGLGVYTGNFTKPTSSLTSTASANPYGGSNTAAIPSGYTKLLLVP